MFYLSLPTWEAWIEIVLNVMLILLQPSSMFQNRETKIEQKGSVLHMLAAEKRKFAEQSLQLALLGDYKYVGSTSLWEYLNFSPRMRG